MTRKRLLLLWLVTIIGISLQAQRVISGSVKNASDNSGIPGATVVVTGTTIGTRTNSEGNYKLTIPESFKGKLQLKANYLGFKNQVINLADGATEANFTLKDDNLKLDEVVVTALGVKKEKRSLGYGTVTVKSEDIVQGGATSVLTGIQGKTTGATITNSGGTPGSSTSIILRGVKSFTGNNQALIVVDGVPINNSSFQNSDNLNNQVDFGNRLNDINPNDIESVTILKGAEGAAIYGSLAVNGVVIITTKSAKKGIKKGRDFSISVNSNYKLQSPLKLPEYQTMFGQGGNGAYDSRENWSWGPRLDGVVRPWGNIVQLPDANGNLVNQIRVKPFSSISDNLANGFNTGRVFTNDISLMKSFEKADVYFSYQNTAQNGIVPNTTLDKNSFRLNTDVDITDKLGVTLNANYINTNINNSIQGQADNSFYDNLLQIPVDIPIAELKDYNNPFNTITNYYGAYTYNPFQMIDYNNASSKVNRFVLSATVDYAPFSWLKITERAGYDNYTDSRYFRENKFTNTNQNPSQSSPIGKYGEDIRRNTLLNNDFMATIENKITKDLKYNFLAGFNVWNNKLETSSAVTSGLAIPNYYNLGNSDGRPVTSNSSSDHLKYGIYGNFEVNYKDYFYLGITGRQDWSSTLPANNRSYFYPGISSSFIFSDLLKDKFLTYGKLRASWTQVGKDANPYGLTTIFQQTSIADGYNNSLVRTPFIGSDGSSQVAGYTKENSAGNPNLRPEMQTSWELGTELGFFNDRLYVDMAIYQSIIKDQIITVDVPASTGYTSMLINAGKMTNNGYEIGIKGIPYTSKRLKVEAFLNFSQNVNVVNEVYPGVKRFSLGGVSGAAPYIDSGNSVGTFYVNGYDRSPDGRMVVDAVTGLPVLSGNLVKMGTYLPDWTMGFGAGFTLDKRLRFNILFDWKKGGVFYSRTKDIMEFLGSATTTTINNREDYVIPNTVNLVNGNYVENTTATSVQEWMTQQSDAENNMIDASYFKLREISLYYNIPLKSSFSKYVKSIDIGVFGNNLFVWLPSVNKYVDPEINSFGTSNVQGMDFTNIPSVKSVGANLKLTF